jgi:hypothetical protein
VFEKLKDILAAASWKTFGMAKAKPQGSISARVYRAATDTWEDLGVIAEASKE